MSDYLTKPITKKSVVNILKKWLPNAIVEGWKNCDKCK
jgi:YesN/AraC family two-component response regulator